MSLVDIVKHALPMKLADGKRHVWPTLASMVYLKDGTTPLADGDGKITADNALNAAKLNGKAPEYYLQPRNLLDNSDFTKPVNQRGQESYTDTDTSKFNYFFDRWLARAGGQTIGINNSGLVITSEASTTRAIGISQAIPFERLAGKTITLAVKYKENTGKRIISIRFGTTSSSWGEEKSAIKESVENNTGILLVTTTIPETSEYTLVNIFAGVNTNFVGRTVIEWAALYEGEYTAETLPPYVPKGYVAELAECQRYYYRIGFRTLHPAYLKFNGSTAAISVCTPLPMRSDAPTFVGDASQLRVYGNGTAYSGFQVYACVNDGSACVLEVNTSNTLPTGQSYFARFDSDGVYAISADL